MYAGQRKTQRVFPVTSCFSIVPVVRRPDFTGRGPYSDSAREVVAEELEQKKFPRGTDFRPSGEILSQVSFGQQVREKRHYPSAGVGKFGDQPAEFIRKTGAYDGSVFIFYVSVVQAEIRAFVTVDKRAYGLAVEQDIQYSDVSHGLSRFDLAPTRFRFRSRF